MPFKQSKYLFLFVSLINITISKAQLGKEAWHWQFGFNCALDFSSGIPTSDTSALHIPEGSASISDQNTGQLLFYTDGTFVWDKNNIQMPNGFGMIGGGGTSSQAALIIPKPGSATIYYIITADEGGYSNSGNQGVNYSIIDITLNGGLGDVVAGSKNLPLTPPPTTEKLTAVRHCNGKDYWILTHPFNSNSFNAYLVTSTGINPIPVVSSVGTMQSSASADATIGYMKASPNGKKLALGIVYYIPILEIYDFDNSTGQVTNPITVTFSQYGAYGISFSPNSTKLYSTNIVTGELFQFDLSSNNPSTIIASKTNIVDSLVGHIGGIGALQLGSDGKIYLSPNDSGSLAVINDPDSLGPSCNYKLHGVALDNRTRSVNGLPNFLDANNILPISSSSVISLCGFSSYTLNASSGNSNYQWQNGDTTKNISINNFGDYWVTYYNPEGCKEVDIFHVNNIPPPVIDNIKDSLECGLSFLPISINATCSDAISYLWSDGYNAQTHIFSNPGTYWVDYILDNFCVSRDSFSLSVYSNPPKINLGNDTSFCIGSKELNAYTPFCTYLWNTGEVTSSIIATHPNNYWVEVNYKGCITYDSIIIYPEYSAFNYILPNIVTPNNDGINDYIDFGKYQFSSLQLEIYNRWGNKVFESSDAACIWKPVENDGIHFVVMNCRIDCGIKSQIKSYKEFITILR